MSALAAGFKALFLLTTVTSALGFAFAWTLHTSNGPTKKISDFSVFMAYSLGLYLFACLGSSFFCASSGEWLLAVLLLLLFLFPFVLALFARSYSQARTVFVIQIIGLIAGGMALARLGFFSARM
jgi:hypothetical protein